WAAWPKGLPVLVRPMTGANALLAALGVEGAEFQSAHGEPRRRLVQDAVEAVVAKSVARLRRRLAAFGLRHRLAPEGAHAPRACRIDVVVGDRLAGAVGTETGMGGDGGD